jgi:hypothetical protein
MAHSVILIAARRYQAHLYSMDAEKRMVPL